MRRWCLIAGVGLASLALATGCGSSDDDSTGSSTSADTTAASGGDSGGDSSMAGLQKIVDAARQPVTEWPGPLTSPPVKKDQFVFSIPCAKVAEGCARQDAGVKAAAEAIGWKYDTVDPAGNPDKDNAAVEQAINAGADVIIMHAIDPSIVSQPLKKAMKAGITVICAACETDATTDISGQVTFDPEKQGEILGAYVATASDGKAKLVAFNDLEFPVVMKRWTGFESSLGQCPDCDVLENSKFLVTDIGTSLGGKAQSVLQSNPDADWVYVAYDSAASDVIQTAGQAGAKAVKIVSYDGLKANIAYVEQGKQDADVGGALEWVGWAAVDDANRILNDSEPVENPNVPSKLITKENASEYAGTGFQGDIDYQAKYEQLWSTGKTTK